jgi:hypothetical protein
VRSPEAAVVLAKQLARGQDAAGGAGECARADRDRRRAGAGDGAVRSSRPQIGTKPGVRAAALAAMDKSIRQRNVAPATLDDVEVLRRSSTSSTNPFALPRCGWPARGTSKLLMPRSNAPPALRIRSLAIRQAAIAALADAGPNHADFLRTLDKADRSRDVRVMAIVALSAIDVPMPPIAPRISFPTFRFVRSI